MCVIEKKDKTKIFIIVIFILSILVLIMGCCLIYLGINNNLENNDSEIKDDNQIVIPDNDKEETDEITDDESDINITRNGKKLTVYSYTYTYNDKVYKNVYTEFPNWSNDKDKFISYKITCWTDNCSFSEKAIDREAQDDYVLVKDGDKIILYNYIDDSVVTEFNDEEIKSIGFGIRDEALVILKNNGKYGVYNYMKNKLTIQYEYDNIKEVAYGGFQDTRGYYYDIVLNNGVIVEKDSKEGIINYQNGESILDVEYDDVLCYKSEVGDDNFEYCKVKSNNKYEIYQYKNNRLVNLNYYVDDVYDIWKNYAYVLNNSLLELVDLSMNSVINTYNEFDIKDDFFVMLNHEDNVTIIFNNNDSENDNEKCIEYYYNLNDNSVGSTKAECGGIGKPVLYLYPEEEVNVTVDFANENILTTTYPKFVNKWEVLAKPNGDLYDKNGKYYYGLYWEEKLINRVKFDKGFYVEKDNAIEFLEEKISYIGLSDRERNEFIMYWLPILEKNGKNLVYFELTEERENTNKININPKPDSLLRIVIHVKKVDRKVQIKEQKLERFERKGFVAVEWGGHNY